MTNNTAIADQNLTIHKYRPVVFLSGGEDGVCGGRSFEARPTGLGGSMHFLVTERKTGESFHAANLGEIRDGIEATVNQ